MKGLVHIGLRHGDVVLEPARNGLIQFMDHTQGRIAVLHIVHQDPHCKEVVDLIQGLLLVHHLFIDAEEMLDPAHHLGLDPSLLHMLGDLVYDTRDELLPGILLQGDLLRQVIIDLRLQIL